MSLKADVFRSAVWSAVQTSGNQLTSFVVFLLLTRILTPAEIGLVALAISFIDLAGPVMRGGLPEALIQRDGQTELQADTCFWSTLAFSLVLAGAVVASAGLFARIFSTPLLAPVLRGLAPMLVLGALTAAHEARMTRAFGYRALAMRGLIANLLGGLVGVTLALSGYGIWSLVIQRIFVSVTSVVFIWAAYRWMPRLRFSWIDLKSMSRFGIPMVAIGFLSTLNGRVADFVLGYWLGPAAVGHVRVASRCVEMVTQFSMAPLLSVALPALSRLQSDRAAFERALQRMVQVCAFVTFPAFLGMAAVSKELVPLVFGPQWKLSGVLLPIMCLNVIPIALQYFTWPALAAVGRSDRAALGVFIVVASSVVATVFAARFGVVAAVAANVVRSYATLPVSLMLLHHYTGVRARSLIGVVVLPLSGSLAMAAVVYCLGSATAAFPVRWRMAIMILGGLSTYLAFLSVFARGLVGELKAMRLQRSPA